MGDSASQPKNERSEASLIEQCVRRIDVLEARAEIQEVLARYGRALDLRDLALLRSCFHGDSKHEHGFVGNSADFCEFAMLFLKQMKCTHHLIGNISITVNGDKADVEAYFCAYHRTPSHGEMAIPDSRPDEDVFIAGRYIDKFERRGGRWLIAARQGKEEWWRFEAAADRGHMS